MAILRLRDESGKVYEVIALRGPRGLKGEDAYAKVVEYGYEGDEEEFYLAMSRNGKAPDKTLTKSGECADSKATGDKLMEASDRMNDIDIAMAGIMEDTVSKAGDTMVGDLAIRKKNPGIFLDGDNGVMGFMDYDVDNKRLDIGLVDYEHSVDPEIGDSGFVLGDPDSYHPMYGARLRLGAIENWHELGFQPQFVSEDDSSVHPILTAANHSAFGVPKIACGSYQGDGTYGAGNANTLTFPFHPKLVIVKRQETDLASNTNYEYMMLAIAGDKNAATNRYYSSTSKLLGVTLTWGENSLTWQGADSGTQLNANGVMYSYIAFG